MIVFVLAVAPLVLVLIAVGRLAWRMLWRNEESVPGGSDGRQLFGRGKS